MIAGVELQQQLGQVDALGAREPGGRLVQHHQLRLRDARHADLELALLAVGELGHQHVEAVGQPDRLGHRARLVAHLDVGLAVDQAQVAVADAEHGQVEVVLDAQPAEQARGLERAREPHAGACSGGRRR